VARPTVPNQRCGVREGQSHFDIVAPHRRMFPSVSVPDLVLSDSSQADAIDHKQFLQSHLVLVNEVVPQLEQPQPAESTKTNSFPSEGQQPLRGSKNIEAQAQHVEWRDQQMTHSILTDGGSGERQFVCEVAGCGKRFATANVLRVHRRTHTGERPYACKVCPKAFASHTNLKNHRRTHSGDRPHACEHPGCGRRFATYSELFKHGLVHSAGRLPFPCRLCDKGYRLAATLALHLKTVHGLDESPDGLSLEASSLPNDSPRPLVVFIPISSSSSNNS
jgi:uncharacterized Zn-finger protein